jgi:micrococcal nuclease
VADKMNLVLNKNHFGQGEEISRGEVSEYIFRALVISENGMTAFTTALRDSFLDTKLSDVSELYEVSRVVDGDTIYLTNGDEIRLLGINSPEVGNCYYSEATNYLKALIGDSKISIKDDSTNEDKDKYGRLLRYIYVNGEMLNIKMVQEGCAEYMKEYPIIYAADFSEAENQANIAEKGMWGACDSDSVDATVVQKNDSTGLYISTVFYDGVVPTVESDEYVEVKNGGSSAINLKGYYIKGSKGTEIFTFSNLNLGSGESVKVYTNQGTYSFGSSRAIWNNGGETAYLYRAEGVMVDEWGW